MHKCNLDKPASLLTHFNTCACLLKFNKNHILPIFLIIAFKSHHLNCIFGSEKFEDKDIASSTISGIRAAKLELMKNMLNSNRSR